MFDKVNVSSLNSAISNCKNNLQDGRARAALNGISSGTVWQANAKSQLVDALEDLVNNKYKRLVVELENCSKMSKLISNYKDLEDENKSLRKRINNLEDELYYDREIIDAEGNTTTERIKDEYVESQIDDLKYEIKNNKERMKDIEKDVSNIVG